jgi:ABC-2 type transport system permease protein
MNAFIRETSAEILKAFRAPEFIFPSVLMPSCFYLMFAIVLPGASNKAAYLLATYGVFAVMGPSIFGFGVGVATERDRGWLQLKQAVPASAFSYIGAKLTTTVLFSTLALLPIYLIAGFFGEVELARATWFSLFGMHVLAAFPFVFIGLILGFCLSSGGAVAVANIIFFSLSILGGLWFPVFTFPPLMQDIALFMPSYHLGELALAIVGAPGEHASGFNGISILIMTLILFSLALVAWVRQR